MIAEQSALRSGLLADRVALVTGGGSGIGRATAARLAHEGALVVAADIDGRAALQTAELLGTQGFSIEMDVVDRPSVEAGMQKVLEKFGALDILVNNAGRVVPGTVDSLDVEDWDVQCDTNLKSVYMVSRAARPLLTTRPGGCVINTGSTAGLVATRDRAAYCASKAGVIMLTKCLALDWADAGIRVNCVCPGWIDTPMVRDLLHDAPDPTAALEDAANVHPLGRMGEPGDIADAMVFLASSSASWVTGSVLVVDGGLISGV